MPSRSAAARPWRMTPSSLPRDAEPPAERLPLRVVFDRRGRLRADSRLARPPLLGRPARGAAGRAGAAAGGRAADGGLARGGARTLGARELPRCSSRAAPSWPRRYCARASSMRSRCSWRQADRRRRPPAARAARRGSAGRLRRGCTRRVCAGSGPTSSSRACCTRCLRPPPYSARVFTGIVEELGRVTSVEGDEDGLQLHVEAPALAPLSAIGDSINVSGCCLTVVAGAGARSPSRSCRSRCAGRRWAVSSPARRSTWRTRCGPASPTAGTSCRARGRRGGARRAP